MTDILSCPFCGGEGHPRSTSDEWIKCLDCGAAGPTEDTEAEAIAAWNARALSATRTETPTHRHKKRGSEYVLIGMGKVQAENWHSQAPGFAFSVPVPVDMAEVAIYRDVKDGSLWARPREEFEDGRFEPLSTTEGE